jgi:hypothetical protein
MGVYRVRLGLLVALALAAGLGAAPARASGLTSYVLIGEDGARVARVITPDAQCPTMRLDGQPAPMTVRAPAHTVPARSAKPAVFDGLVCEATIPAGVTRASVEGRNLPLPPAVIQRMAIIGDTGCRILPTKDGQACNDPSEKGYPFARVAASVARWKPDLVVHVGDYLYREQPCPEGNAGCAGSAWGYGADAWRQDWFDPAAPMFTAAPLALSRGNHETCVRAGQGWWLYLDPRPLAPHRDCNDKADDDIGDFSIPYAVPLGQHSQLIMFDSAATSGKPLAADDPRAVHYRQAYAKIAALAAASPHSMLVNHHPILGFAAYQGPSGPFLAPGNGGLQSVFGAYSPSYVPAGVDVLLAGHIHVWEAVSFSSDHPGQIIAGFSGTLEDIVPIPAAPPPGAAPAKGAVVKALSSWVVGFGFMTLERVGDGAWNAQVRDVDGHVVNTCKIRGSDIACALAQAPGRG